MQHINPRPQMGKHSVTGRVEQDGVELVAQVRRQNRFDALQGLVGPKHILRAAPGTHKASPQDERGQLATSKHQRRKIHVASQSIAHARFPFDRGPSELKILDIAINGSLRNLQLRGERLRRLQPPLTEKLDNTKETVCSSHEDDLRGESC